MIKPYWTAEIYGFGKWLRKYGFYPKSFPLCVYLNHGAGHNDQLPAKHELETDAPTIFYHSQRTVEKWRKMSQKPCFTLYSLFVFARRKLKVRQSKNAKGSIFFIAHATRNIKDEQDIAVYHELIQSVPKSFRPVTLCFHIHDIRDGLHKMYENLGYRWVSAGDSLRPDFTENFYHILKEYRYCLSNLIGSYSYYSVEMGTPFSLIGTDPAYMNYGDKNVEKGEYNSFLREEGYLEGKRLFNGFHKTITPAQVAYVNDGLGLTRGTGRLSMFFILYVSLFKWLSKSENRSIFFRDLRKNIASSIKGILSKILHFSIAKGLKKLGIYPKAKSKDYPQELAQVKLGLNLNDAIRLMKVDEPVEISFFDRKILAPGRESFIHLSKPIFLDKIFDFVTRSETPVIAEYGNSMGLTSLFFKTLYPTCQIQLMVSHKEELPYNQYLIKHNDLPNLKISEKVGDLSAFLVAALDKQLDLLKIDLFNSDMNIILKSIESISQKVPLIMIIWKSESKTQQNLQDLLRAFSDFGYRYSFNSIGHVNRNYMGQTKAAVDQELICYFYK